MEKIICPKCKKLVPHHSFCVMCGAPLPEISTVTPDLKQKTVSRQQNYSHLQQRRSGQRLLIPVILLTIIGLVLVFVLVGSKNNWFGIPEFITSITSAGENELETVATINVEEPVVTEEAGIAATPTELSVTSEPLLAAQPYNYEEGENSESEIDSMQLLYIPQGEFIMGSPDGVWEDDEEPMHTVYLDAFWIDATEVTNAMYEKCVEDGICTVPGESISITRDSYYGNPQYDDYPVIYVNWYQANTYCEWAGRRLPTEAEWEKAARGENGFTFPWGNQFDCSNGNFDDETMFDDYVVDGGEYCDRFIDTAPVGSYPYGASPYGALDMAGNVWEWVKDWYTIDYPSGYTMNPEGPSTGDEKVMRGGSWDNVIGYVRTAQRISNNPLAIFKNAGFRCALSPQN